MPGEHMSGHTPGAWTLFQDGANTYRFEVGVLSPKGARIITARIPTPRRSPGECEANARLIAAAPALLDALRRLTALVEEPRQPNPWETDAVLMAARAALAAAVGDAGKEGS
jgi:hypothetical protein